MKSTTLSLAFATHTSVMAALLFAGCTTPLPIADSGVLLDAVSNDGARRDSSMTDSSVDAEASSPPQDSGADSEASTTMDAPDAMDAAGNDSGSAQDSGRADVPSSSDTGVNCVAPDGRCDINSNNCCAGTVCMNGFAGATCIRAPMCAAANDNCAPGGNPCCAGLVCMQAGGIGGMRCASPNCRRAFQACDDANPCCPSSACAGGPGGRMCLPTP